MIQEVVEAMEGMVREVMNNSLHTAMPGKILAYDAATGMANVQPIGSFYCGKVEMDYPVIPSVPVCISANSSGIAACLPIKAGDIVLLVCAEQSLSAFLTETSEAQSNERFELTNCIAIPSLVRVPVEAQKEANEKEAIVLTNGKTKVVIEEEKIEITGDVSVEGEVEITGNITITGETVFSGKTTVKGNLSVEGNITANGDISGANTEVAT